MTIETKYNIGDEVWAMYNNSPFKYKIDKVIIVQNKLLQYRVVGHEYFFESELFPTKEELLKSLVMELYDSKYCQSLKKQIEETDSIKKRHRLINKYLAERIRRVETVMAQEFPDEVSYEEMIECLWEDLKLAQRQIIYTYHKVL